MFSRSEYRNQLSVIATATWYHLAWADIARPNPKSSRSLNLSIHPFLLFIAEQEKIQAALSVKEPIWVFPKIGVPQNGWFIMENLVKIDDLGVPLFLETPI